MSSGSASSGRPSNPDRAAPTNPRSAHPAPLGIAHEWNQAVAEQYLDHVAATVKLLARYGIYTLLDMHQDVYNKNFRGEGAPNWAVCTDNVPIVPKGGRWSNNYSNPTLQTAVQHFWSNDVVGNLQGNFDLVWKTVAERLQERPLGGRLRPVQRTLLDGDADGVGVDLHGPIGVLLHGEGPHRIPGQRDVAVDLPARRAGQRRHPDDPGRRPAPPDLRGAGHLLGDRRQRPFPAGPDALPAHRLQLPRLLRGPQPRDREPDQPPQVPPVRGDRGIRAGRHPPLHELRRTSRADRPSS